MSGSKRPEKQTKNVVIILIIFLFILVIDLMRLNYDYRPLHSAVLPSYHPL